MGDDDTQEDRNNHQGQRTGRNEHDNGGSDSSSDSRSSNALSVRSFLRLRNKTQQEQRTESIEQEKWKSFTGISIPAGSKKLSKQLKGVKMEAPENLDGSKRKWTDS